MSIPLTVNNVTYNYPTNGEIGWGTQATGWANAITNGTLQKTGGLFSLTSDLDFGPTGGLKAVFFSSRTIPAATTGVFRLANNEFIGWRNAANTGNATIGLDNIDNYRISTAATPNAAVITADGNMGLGTTTPLAANLGGKNLSIYNGLNSGTVESNSTLQIQSQSRNSVIRLIGGLGSNNAVNFIDPDGNDSYARILAPQVDRALAFFTGSNLNERMRINSAGQVSMGEVISPAGARLNVIADQSTPTNVIMRGTVYGNNATIATRSTGGTQLAPTATPLGQSVMNLVGSTTSDGVTFNNTAAISFSLVENPTATSQPTSILFQTALPGSITRNEKARITHNGHFCLGVDFANPWSSGIKAIEVLGGNIFGDTSGLNIALTANAYFSDNWRTRNTGASSVYSQNAGTHIWYTGSSVAAGSVIPLGERMRLDLSGGLLIGTINPYSTSRLVVNAFAQPFTVLDSNQIAVGEPSGNPAYRMQVGYGNIGGNWKGSIQSYANSVASDVILNGAGGNVGIGNLSPTFTLDVQGVARVRNNINAAIAVETTDQGQAGFLKFTDGADQSVLFGGGRTYNAFGGVGSLNLQSNGDTVFHTTASFSERMRITGAGNVLMGTPSVFYNGGVGSTNIASPNAPLGLRNTNAVAGKHWIIGPSSSNAIFVINDTFVGVQIVDGGTAWVANSDETEKTNFVEFSGALGKVATLRAGTGRFISDDETKSRSFLIAQDVQAVLPEAVYRLEETGKLGLAYTEVIPLLVAAIKELKTRIEELEAA